jgi:hypothetical protein
VWGDRLFVTSVVDTQGALQATVCCVDRATGRLHWQQPVGPVEGASHSKNGHASATVATDGERVYAAFNSLGICALDMSGEMVWYVALPRQKHEWGASASPLLLGDLLIHVIDGENDSAIVAFDRTNGQEVWRTPRASRGSWTSPVAIDDGDAATPAWQVIVNGTGSGNSSPGDVIAYDSRTGAEIWKARGTTDIACPTAIVGQDLVVSTSGGNGPIFAIRPDGRGDVTQSHCTWRLPSGGAYVPTGVIYADRLYLISDAGLVTCHRLDDGSIVWRKRLQGAFSASLVAGAGHLYAVSERGDVYVFKAADRFELVATNRLREPCLATPALAHGEVYLRSERFVYCIAKPIELAAEPASVAPTVDPAAIRSPADVEATSALVSPDAPSPALNATP